MGALCTVHATSKVEPAPQSAAASQFQVRLVVEKAHSLPKTDVLSKIDAYIRVKAGSQEFKTKVIDDHDSPTWNEVFFPVISANGSILAGCIEFELWDANVVKDSKVGTAVLQLDGKAPADLSHCVLPFTWADKKHDGRKSTLSVALVGAVQTYESLKHMWADTPGALYDDAVRAVYVPVPGQEGRVMTGVKYEDGGRVDIKVLLTQPLSDELFADLLLVTPEGQSQKATRVQRKTHPQGRLLVPGGSVQVYEELKLDDLPVGLDYNWASVVVLELGQPECSDADRISTAHGWAGALNFEAAARTLHGVEIDYDAQEIYMTAMPGEAMLLVDYDKDDADVKLAVQATPHTAAHVYDMRLLRTRSTYSKTSQAFFPYKAKLHGRLALSRIIELGDLPYGTALKDIQLLKWRVAGSKQLTVQALTRLMG